jgi:hypothetical protein
MLEPSKKDPNVPLNELINEMSLLDIKNASEVLNVLKSPKNKKFLTAAAVEQNQKKYKLPPQHESWEADQEILKNHGTRGVVYEGKFKLIELSVEDAGYKLVDELFKKSQQNVGPRLSKTSLKDFKISKVKLIDNPNFYNSFEEEAFLLSQRRGKEAFIPDLNAVTNKEWRQKILKEFEEKTTKKYSNEKCYFLPVWHGTKKEVLESVLATGFANLAKTDIGYYGKGIYGSTNAEYVKRVYSGGYHKGILLLNWVAINSAYPVVSMEDIDLLKGKGNKDNFDAHYIQVKPRNQFIHDQGKEDRYFPLVEENETSVYDEIVVFNERHIVARYVVEIERIIPKLEQPMDYFELVIKLLDDEEICLPEDNKKYNKETLLEKAKTLLLQSNNKDFCRIDGNLSKINNELGEIILQKKARNDDDLTSAQGLFLEAINLDRRLSVTYFNLAKTLFLQKKLDIIFNDHERATIISLLKKAIELDANKAEYYILLAKANIYFELALLKKDEIIDLLRQALQLNPWLAESYDLLGSILYVNEVIDVNTNLGIEKLNAQQLLERAITLDSDYYDSYVHLGELLLRNQKLGAKVKLAFPVDLELTAKELFGYAIKLNPKQALAYARLAQSLGKEEIVELSKIKKLDKGEGDCSLDAQVIAKKAVSLDGSDPISLIALANTLKAGEDVILENGTSTNARSLCIKAYEIAIGKRKDKLPQFFNLSEIIFQLARHMKNEEKVELEWLGNENFRQTQVILLTKQGLLKKVIELQPDHKAAVLVLSKSWYDSTNKEAAKEEIQKLLKNLLKYYPGDAKILDQLGLWLEMGERIAIQGISDCLTKKQLFEEAFKQEPTNQEIYGHLCTLGELSIDALISNLKGQSEREIKADIAMVQGLDLYVSTKSTNLNLEEENQKLEEKDVVELEENVDKFLNSTAEQILLLQGRAGSGKSIFGRLLEMKLWEKYLNQKERGIEGGIIPLFVSLPQIITPTEELIEKALKLKGFSDQTINLLKSQEFVLILDGFDEIGKKKPIIHDNKFFETSPWRIKKIIVTARLGYLSKAEEVLLTTNNNQTGLNQVKKCFILPFSQDRIADYISKYSRSLIYNESKWDKNKYQEVLAKFARQGINELITDPCLLQLILKILPVLEQEHCRSENQAIVKITRFKVYEFFMENWFKKEAQKLINFRKNYSYCEEDIVKIMQVYATELSFNLLLEGRQLIEAIKTIKKATTLEDILLDTLVNKDQIKSEKLLRFFASDNKEARHILKIGLKGCPLKKISDNSYIFTHRSFYEYFVAKKIINEILSLDTFDGLTLNLAINQKSLVGEFSIISFISDIAATEIKLKNILIALHEHINIMMTAVEKEKFSTASINILAILHNRQYEFAYKISKKIIEPNKILELLDTLTSLSKEKSSQGKKFPNIARPLKNINLIIDFIKVTLDKDDLIKFIDKVKKMFIWMFKNENWVRGNDLDGSSRFNIFYNFFIIIQAILPIDIKSQENWKQKSIQDRVLQYFYKYSEQSFPKLLDYITKNNQNAVKQMVLSNGFLTMMSGHMAGDGRTDQQVTALQYSIQLLNTTIWDNLILYMPKQEVNKQILKLKESQANLGIFEFQSNGECCKLMFLPELLIFLPELLNCVGKGKVQEADTLLRNYPSLGKFCGDLTDWSGRVFKRITAYQYAILALDETMFNMISRHLSFEEKEKQLRQLLEIVELDNNEGWVKKKTSSIIWPSLSWKTLIKALNNYLNFYLKTFNCELNDDKTVNYGNSDQWTECFNLWSEVVGGAQLKLPAHIIREYYAKINCDFSGGWLIEEKSVLGKDFGWVIIEGKGSVSYDGRGGNIKWRVAVNKNKLELEKLMKEKIKSIKILLKDFELNKIEADFASQCSILSGRPESQTKILKLIDPTSDGNCGFNAFALGLYDLILSRPEVIPDNCYEKLRLLLRNAEVNDKETFIKWVHGQNEKQIQKKLQIILRNIAVDYIEVHYESGFKEVYEEQLLGAYRMFVEAYNNKASVEEDTFVSHPYIKKKFQELFSNTEQINVRIMLLSWWRDEGRAMYFATMRGSAETPMDKKRWGGEPELNALAVYFNIKIEWERQHGIRKIGVNNGTIEDLIEDELSLLRNLGVGETIGNKFEITINSMEELNKAIYPLNLSTNDKKALDHFFETINDNMIEFPKNIVGILSMDELKKKLIERGILNGNRFITKEHNIMDKERIVQKINGISSEELKQKVLRAFQPKSIAFRLRNNGNHWTYCRSTDLCSSSFLEKQDNHNYFMPVFNKSLVLNGSTGTLLNEKHLGEGSMLEPTKMQENYDNAQNYKVNVPENNQKFNEAIIHMIANAKEFFAAKASDGVYLFKQYFNGKEYKFFGLNKKIQGSIDYDWLRCMLFKEQGLLRNEQVVEVIGDSSKFDLEGSLLAKQHFEREMNGFKEYCFMVILVKQI